MLRLRNTLRAKAYQDHLIYYDSLTGLPNRLRFAERLALALEHAKRTNECGAILHIDLDRFKTINDSLGHSTGDKLLQAVARRLELRIRDGDSLGRLHDADVRASLSRLGGDEYTILLPGMERPESAAHVAQRILAAMDEPFEVDGNELFVTPSIGISVFPDDGEDIDTLLKNADIAMYHAKQHGRNGFEFYSSEMNSRSLERLNLENRLRNALDNNELQLYYQPKVDVMTGSVVGAEALLRWEHPELGMVSPVEFIPLAEEAGLIVQIGAWVLKTACNQAMEWQAAGYEPLKIAVNVSIRQFNEPAWINTVQAVLEQSGLQPGNLTLEFTENMLMDGAETNVEKLRLLKKLGINISIDDFGTGYSSLSYLQKFTIDELKIDMSFIRQIQSGTDKAPIVDAVIAMAQNLSLDIVAEGVETDMQLEYLKQRGCGVYQGFLFSKPVTAAGFANLLDDPRSSD
jgi:diguanylate cyclase (GGDEF)-like protein